MAENTTIRLSNRFDFSQHKSFSTQVEQLLANDTLKQLDIDFSQVQYLDSSALGMLVLLAKKATNQGVTVTLRGAQGTAKDILEMANMHKLFQIG
jgi:anti-anti-sigma factor